MRATILACIMIAASGAALAGGEPLSSGSTAGHLGAPTYNVIGKTASTRVTTISPRDVVTPAGALGADEEDGALRGADRIDRPLLLERRLDCFSSALAPDRDTRNRFLSRCPGNNR